MKIKYRNNVRGFTLVELLAIIVVLAIVMVIAVTAVMPTLERARKNAFAIEANGLADSAKQYIITASITSTGRVITDAHPGCITVSELVKSGDSELSDAYDGKVVIHKLNNTYTYDIYLTNKSYMVLYTAGTNVNENVTGDDDVVAFDSTAWGSSNQCATGELNLATGQIVGSSTTTPEENPGS